MLASEVTDSVFEGYKEHYDMYSTAVRVAAKEMAQLARESTRIKSELKRTRDLQEKQELIERASVAAAQYAEHKAEKAMMGELAQEFSFMRGVKNINAFRKKIQTCAFWADTWAISTLERTLNVKFVLLSKEAYESGDLGNVLHCGQLNDSILEEKGSFTPDWYLMLSYDGSHYQIITFKGIGAFKFKQLPYDIKEMIVDKCLERMAGPYAIIPEVLEYKMEADVDGDDDAEEKAEEREANNGKEIIELEVSELDVAKEDEDDAVALAQKSEAEAKAAEEATGEAVADLDEAEGDLGNVDAIEKSLDKGPNPILHSDDVFQFYDKSAAKALPGKGPGESMSQTRSRFAFV